MTARSKPIEQTLPTLEDVGRGIVTLDEYEIAHGEDIPEWTEEDFRRGRPITDFPELLEAVENFRRGRGPQLSPTKERVGLRLDRAVVDHFRATGPGWQSRINALLLDHVRGVEAHSKQPVGPASRGETR
jgi:uncharacterized protein (DUF4415 family)